MFFVVMPAISTTIALFGLPAEWHFVGVKNAAKKDGRTQIIKDWFC